MVLDFTAMGQFLAMVFWQPFASISAAMIVFFMVVMFTVKLHHRLIKTPDPR